MSNVFICHAFAMLVLVENVSLSTFFLLTLKFNGLSLVWANNHKFHYWCESFDFNLGHSHIVLVFGVHNPPPITWHIAVPGC